MLDLSLWTFCWHHNNFGNKASKKAKSFVRHINIYSSVLDIENINILFHPFSRKHINYTIPNFFLIPFGCFDGFLEGGFNFGV